MRHLLSSANLKLSGLSIYRSWENSPTCLCR